MLLVYKSPLGRLAPFWMLGSQPQGSSIQSCISPLSSISYSLQRQFQIFSALLWFPTFYFSPSHLKLITLFPTSLREEIISVCQISTPHPQIDKPAVLGPIISPSCFNGGSFKFLLPYSGHLLLFPEYFINLFLLLSYYLPLYILDTFCQHKLAYDFPVLGRKKWESFDITHNSLWLLLALTLFSIHSQT